MKLAQVQPGYVARNLNNGSHYRFERIERGKARIWPLELFPCGLLIAKPTPTLVDCDLEVVEIGPWAEGMVVEGTPTHSRRVYENELVRRERELVELRVAYEALPAGGKGKLSRGSWANKVKNVEIRLTTLKRGLGFVATTTAAAAFVAEPVNVAFAPGQVVQMPSGRFARITGFQNQGDTIYAGVLTSYQGKAIQGAVPCEVLRTLDKARLCTV